ncbi:MAG: biotin transporter BioY [Christensenellales bacterium]|jgi:biotin transport system substrate-specific component
MKTPAIDTKALARIGLMTAVTVGLSFVRIAFIVPFTLQTLACMIAGLLLPRREAVVSQALYVFLGLAGLPVFTAGGGFSYALYHTFGYIIYLPLMAYTISALKAKSGILAMAAGIIPQLVFGMLYYYVIVTKVQGATQEIGKLFSLLVLPFIPAEALKAFSALLIYRYLPSKLKNF